MAYTMGFFISYIFIALLVVGGVFLCLAYRKLYRELQALSDELEILKKIVEVYEEVVKENRKKMFTMSDEELEKIKQMFEDLI